MRPTRAGASACIDRHGRPAVIAGRILGLLELFVLAAMCGAALLFAVIYTATIRLDLAVSIARATPARLRAGSPGPDRPDPGATKVPPVDAPASTPMTACRAHGVRLADVGRHLDRCPAGPDRLPAPHPASRRPQGRPPRADPERPDGVDPRRRLQAAELTTLMIHPAPHRPEAAGGPGRRATRRPTSSPAEPWPISGDEFFALRPYVVGDELKRVNWRASGSHRRPRRAPGGATQDGSDHSHPRPPTDEVYDDEGFERAVSAALSALYSGFRGGDALRFLTTAGSATTDIRTRSDLDAVDEQLALITSTESASLVQLHRRTDRGAAEVRAPWSWSRAGPERAASRPRSPMPGSSFGLVVVISPASAPTGRRRARGPSITTGPQRSSVPPG